MTNRTYTLDLHITKDGALGPYRTDTVQAESMVHLVLQFTMLISQLERQLHDEDLIELKEEINESYDNNDIPF